MVRRGGDYLIHGDTLVAPKGAVLPDVCIYSGEPSRDRVQRKLVWVPPALAALVVISPLIYLIVYFIVRKTGTLDYSLGEAARKRRQSGIAIAIGSIGVFVALLFIGLNTDAGSFIPLALLLFIVGLVVGTLRARVVQLVKIDKTHIHLKLPPAAAQAFASAQAQ